MGLETDNKHSSHISLHYIVNPASKVVTGNAISMSTSYRSCNINDLGDLHPTHLVRWMLLRNAGLLMLSFQGEELWVCK